MKLVFHHSYGSEMPPARLRNTNKLDRPFTLVLDALPSRDDILKLIEEVLDQSAATSCVEIKVGYSVVHPKDQFDRKVGLEKAMSRVKPELLTIEGISATRDGRVLLGLSMYDHKLQSSFHLTLSYLPSGRPSVDPEQAKYFAYSMAGILEGGR